MCLAEMECLYALHHFRLASGRQIKKRYAKTAYRFYSFLSQQRFKKALGNSRRLVPAKRTEIQRSRMLAQRLKQQLLLRQIDVTHQLGDVRAAVHIVRVFLKRPLELRIDRRNRLQLFQRRTQRIVLMSPPTAQPALRFVRDRIRRAARHPRPSDTHGGA